MDGRAESLDACGSDSAPRARRPGSSLGPGPGPGRQPGTHRRAMRAESECAPWSRVQCACVDSEWPGAALPRPRPRPRLRPQPPPRPRPRTRLPCLALGALLLALLAAEVQLNSATTAPAEDPEFTEQIENITVPAGRNVKLACSVKNLGTYKVAWMHFEQSAILTVHNHVITRNPRISVTHDKHRTWFLHITNVQEEDKGRYMCQINTVTAKTQFGFLHVVVPPNIDDSLSSSDVIVREGANVTLTCHATGSPPPSVKWKRDDGSKIAINKSHSVLEWEGEVLEMTRISRLDMGAYLCIASNGVPPTVSKRIKVSVDFPPMLWIPHQLVGAPLGYSVTLECFTEAHPTSLNYWTREDGHMIHESRKYRADNTVGSPSYKTHMKLTINNIQERDYGTYKCVAKNPRGETDGTIRLYTSAPPSTTPGPTSTELVPRRNPDQPWEGISEMNNSVYGSPGLYNGILVDKGKGSKYQSNLNEIDKSEQKSSYDSSGKGVVYEWPQPDSGGGGGAGARARRGGLSFILPVAAYSLLQSRAPLAAR